MNPIIFSIQEIQKSIPTYFLNKAGECLLINSSKQKTSNLYGELNTFDESYDDLLGKDFEFPQWVLQNAKNGFLGEKIAYVYLKQKNPIAKWVSTISSKLGYDIIVGDELFEVKTSHSAVGFIITGHEIKVAQRNKEKYWVFFIVHNVKNKKAEGYLINDPVSRFVIDPQKLLESTETKNSVFTPYQFEVTIEEYIKKMTPIDLSDIYQRFPKQI